MTDKSKQKIYITVSVCVCLLAVLYASGFRVGGPHVIGRVGTVSMVIPTTNTSVFVDDSQKIVTTKNNQDVRITLSPALHTIIVSKESYYPWTKKVTVPSNDTLTLSPILVSQNASGEMIGQADPEYWKIKQEVENSPLPTKDSPLISPDKSQSVWVENNTIISKNESGLHAVVDPTTPIKNVSFYKNRSDAIIFSTSDAIFMIETDTQNTQNFFPIYKGVEPYFVETDPSFIYVEDGKILMQVNI